MNRRRGIHKLASIGGFPEMRDWVADENRSFHRPQIHGTALVNAFVTVDGGVDEPTRVGARAFLMAHCHVGHDAQIGADCELAPHSSVGGFARLGDGVKLGQGATIKPYVVVGAGARIGMGAVVTKDVPAGEVWVGNPARRIGASCVTPEQLVADAWAELSRGAS